MRDVYIVAAKRTAIGSLGGSLKKMEASELGAQTLKSCMEQGNIKPENIDEVIIGNVLTAGQGMNPSRQVSLKAGIPVETPTFTLNKVCGSGMKAMTLGTLAIKAGDADIIACGGIENMNKAPYLLPKAREGYRLGDGKIIDHMVYDGLSDIFNKYHMGITAENLVEKHNLTREEQDQFAYESQMKAIKAIEEGKFKDEIVPIELKDRKGNITIFDTDEHPKKGTSLEGLAKLRPAFKKDGSVTAGNSSGINDGAAIFILASKEKVDELGLKPLAKIAAYSSGGVDPSVMGEGPVSAINNLFGKTNYTFEDIELWELNEAFAAQSLAVYKNFPQIPHDKVNVNGGAIALGHPIGASGARITVTLLYEMIKRDNKIGLASLCIGGGMGISIILERE